VPGTNLREKYLQMTVRENVNPCQSPLSDISPPGSPTETVVFNGIPFFKQIGGDAGAGHHHEWVGYSTLKNNACISMDFVLHSLNGSYPPPPDFDKAAESVVFAQVMQTFAWLSSNSTPTATQTPAPVTETPLPPTGNPQVVTSPNIRKLFMMDSSNGWAIGNSYVLRTGDGGATWYNVSMPGVSSVRNGFFQDSNKGWALTPDALYRTIDGGIRWTQYDVPFNGGYIQFLDDNNGFVLSGELSGMQRHAVYLYQTTNGGATWTLNYANDPSQPNNPLPFSGHKNGMTFRDTLTGWVGGDIPTPGFAYLYKTPDGGRTWAQQPLTLPVGYESAGIIIESPKFFGSNDAILPVWMTTNTGLDLFIYVSHDGGASWTRSAGVVPQGRNVDFISMNDGFAWSLNGFFQVTNNSGASWSQITPNINFGDDMPDMDFVSTTTGWVLQNEINGVTPLYRTSDGGLTWTQLFGNNPTPTHTPTPSADPLAFAQSVVTALNARNFDALPAMMDQTFTFAYWQSQGTSYPSDEAIESLRIGLTVTLIPDAGKDLNALLGGSNPYTIMGLDPAKSQALFVSAWGSDSNAEAILFVTQRPDGSLYWHSVLIAPYRFIHITPTPPALIGPFAVIRVAPNDVLNIRSGAGASYPVVGSFPSDATNIMRTGPIESGDSAFWVEVQKPDGGTGWVNFQYLTEYVSHDAFCADTRIPALIEQLKGSMNQSNGDLFAGLASIKSGIDVRLWAYQPAVNFTAASARNVFTDTNVYNWGTGPRGEPDFGTFAQIIQPRLQEVLNAPNMETYCDTLTKVFPLADPWRYPNIRYYNLYKPGTPGTDLDFRTWLIGFEYLGGQPYLYAMVNIVWEP